MLTLTKKQKNIFDYITKYINKNNCPPTFEQIKKYFKLSSVATVHQHIQALKEKKYLKNKTRGIELQKENLIQIPLLGTISAGQPIEAIEEKETIAVSEYKLPKTGNFFGLRVIGKSMIDENIDDNDIIIVRSQETADNGQKIVALINNEKVTLKKFYKEKNKIRLQPANSAMEPIFVNPKNLMIQGEVINIIKDKNIEETNLKKDKIYSKTIKKTTEINLPNNIEPLILIGDVIEKLQTIPDESINCIITSPPYWNLRDYGVDNQIGSEKNPDNYIKKMLVVTNELRRVLTRDGSFFLNIGDTYTNRNLLMIPEKLTINMQENGWTLRNKIIWHKPNHMPSSIKNRFTNTWEPIFFFIRDDCKRKYYFNLDEIRIPHKTNGNNRKKSNLPKYIDEKTYKKYYSHLTPNNKNGNYNGKFKDQKNKNLGASPGARQSVNNVFYSRQRKQEVDSYKVCTYLKEKKKKVGISAKKVDEYFGYKDTAGHWFRNDESGRSLPSPEDWIKLKKLLKFDDIYDKIMTETHYVLQTVDYHPKGKNPGDIWNINTDKLKEAHFAIFPEELPRKIITGCCPKNGIVLDPFAGSGTTGKVAKELNRKSIMIDINPEYKKIMEKRFKGITSRLF